MNQVEQADQHQTADRSNGGQQSNQRPEGNDKVGHKENLKGRNHFVLTQWSSACCCCLHAFTH